MNVKEYIASGMVESYVMGLLPQENRHEFESLCKQYPEIAEARNSFEIELENRLLADAGKAPQFLHQQIQEKLNTVSFETDYSEDMEENIPERNAGIWKWLAVASMILLAGAAYWAISSNNKFRNSQTLISSLKDSLRKSENNKDSQPLPALARTDFKMASIREQAASATIYWDTTTKDVYLKVHNMPAPAAGKQYQLWALLPENEGAINLGTIALKQEGILYRMKNVQNAKAFAITLEPMGGSPKPTTAPMISDELINL